MGHEVHIATSDYPNGEKEDVIDGITITRYKHLARPLRNPLTPSMLFLKKSISKYDIVHVHNEHSFAAMIAAYFRIRSNVPLILTCHGQLVFGNKVIDWLERIYSKTIGKKIFVIVDKIISLSNSDMNYISSLGINSNKMCVLPNAIDSEELSKMNHSTAELVKIKNSFTQKYGINEKRIIMFVGPVIQRKGVEYLIKSIPDILQGSGGNSVFVLVGGGEFLEKARQLVKKMQISDYVIFTERLTEEELIETYQCADLFVLPSLSEGLPTSILEAMYFGLPVVATAIPGVKDHFKDVALLVPPKNEKKLAEAILAILNDTELAKRLSISGSNLTKNKYTWSMVAKRYEEIYCEMVR